MQNTKPSLCIAVLTHNEAHQIERCLRSAQFADQLVVADSGSTDATVELAKALGAEVFSYPDWQGFGEQRNRLLRHVSTDYVFFLDADECIDPPLQAEIQRLVQDQQAGPWRVKWRAYAFGRPLGMMRQPSGVVRLFQTRDIVQFHGVVHEWAELKGPKRSIQTLKNRLNHYSRDTVHQSLQKLAQYAAAGAVKRRAAGKRGGIARGLASATASFLKTYFWHLGFLCGPQGFLYCLLVALECFFRYVAVRYDPAEAPGSLTTRS